MTITRYRRPREPFSGMFEYPDIFSDRIWDVPSYYGRDVSTAWHPSADVYEDDNLVIVKMDLPGMTKDEIDISFDGHVLAVTGRRDGDDVDGSCHWSRERFHGDFHRYVHIPTDVGSENLKATYENGVLEVALEKAEKVKTKKIAIESGEK